MASVAPADALAGVVSSVALGEGDIADVLPPLAAGTGGGRNCGRSTPTPTRAIRQAANATGTRNRQPEPTLGLPRRLRTPTLIGRRSRIAAGRLVWRQLALSSRSVSR